MMKKIISILILTFILQCNCILAQSVNIELITSDNYYPMVFDEDDNPPDNVMVNGEWYFWHSLQDGRHPIKYNSGYSDFFRSDYDYIFTGDYYLRRFAGADYTSGMDRMKKVELCVYDKQFNLVTSHNFDRYIKRIGYHNSVYYCQEIYNNYWKSDDLINWTKVDSGVVFEDVWGDRVMRILKPSVASNILEYQISLDGKKFYTVEFESENLLSNNRYYGMWLFNKNSSTISFSVDGIYSTNISDQINCEYISEISQLSESDKVNIYEYNNDLIIEWIMPTLSFTQAFSEIKGYRLYIPRQIVYEEINQLKDTPYVIYNNTLLAFEQSPIIEDGSTLIPLRFLFEQMGADVEWDGDTQTATISQNNTAVAFSIDDTEASVNGQEVSMEVPARLINGKTMVPVRFLSENLGYEVDWDEESRVITIK